MALPSISSTTDDTSSLSLLTLPPELRNKIYDHVLNDNEDDILCPFIWQLSPGKRRYTYSLTQTCRQVRQETLLMWHAGKRLLFTMRPSNMAYYRNWLRRRPAEVFGSIRQLRLEDYQHCKVACPEEHPFYCKSAIVINLAKKAPASWIRDRRCLYCPTHDQAVDRVNAVVMALKGANCVVLTREKVEEVFEAAAWV